MDLLALILLLHITKVNPTLCLLLYCELDQRMESIQVVVEFLQLLVGVVPDDKDIIKVPAPSSGLQGGLKAHASRFSTKVLATIGVRTILNTGM